MTSVEAAVSAEQPRGLSGNGWSRTKPELQRSDERKRPLRMRLDDRENKPALKSGFDKACGIDHARITRRTGQIPGSARDAFLVGDAPAWSHTTAGDAHAGRLVRTKSASGKATSVCPNLPRINSGSRFCRGRHATTHYHFGDRSRLGFRDRGNLLRYHPLRFTLR